MLQQKCIYICLDRKGDRQVDTKRGREKKQIDDIALQANTIEEKYIEILIETEMR